MSSVSSRSEASNDSDSSASSSSEDNGAERQQKVNVVIRDNATVKNTGVIGKGNVKNNISRKGSKKRKKHSSKKRNKKERSSPLQSSREPTSSQDFYLESHPDGKWDYLTQSDPIYPTKAKKDTHLQYLKDSKRYPVEHWGENQALLINNWEFAKDPDEKKMRKGAPMDAKNLEKLLKFLGFKVHHKENVTKKEIEKAVKEFTQSDAMERASMALLFIGSHGKQENHHDQFLDAHKELVSVSSLIENFNAKKLPALRGKPKIFWFQFCRRGFVKPGDVEVIDKVAADDLKLYPEHHKADMFFGYATAAGSLSYRDELNGSWFVTAICKVFEKHAREKDLKSLFTLVNNEVMSRRVTYTDKKDKIKTAVQMCSETSQLQRDVFFYPQ